MRNHVQQQSMEKVKHRGSSKVFVLLMSIVLVVGLIPGLSVSQQAYAAQGGEAVASDAEVANVATDVGNAAGDADVDTGSVEAAADADAASDVNAADNADAAADADAAESAATTVATGASAAGTGAAGVAGMVPTAANAFGTAFAANSVGTGAATGASAIGSVSGVSTLSAGAIEPLAVTILKTWDIGADPDHRDALTATCYYDTTTREVSLVIAGEGDAQTFESPDEVPWYADTYSDGFTEIVFDEEPEITNIDYWFYGCTALADLPYIPDSVKSMRYTFYGCPNITFIPKGFMFPGGVVTEKTFYAEEPYSPENPCLIVCSPADFDALDAAYDWASDNRLLSDTMAEWKIGSSVASDVTVTIDGDGTFAVSGTGDVQEFAEMHNGYETPWLLEGYSTRIESVVFEEGVTPTSLEGWFYGCSDLTTTPTLPDTVTNMRNTFMGCTNLNIDESYTLPSSLMNMEQTFMGCTSLTLPEGFVFPETVTNMFKTFYYCDALQIPDDFSFPENAVNISYVFGWSGITSVPANFTIPDSVDNAAGVFYSCVDLTSIGNGFTIGVNVQTIYDMFNYCFSLVSLPDGFTIPDSVTNMSHAFERCSGLTSLPAGFTIGANVEDISYAFYYCRNLEALPAGFMIPDSVTNMSYAFDRCSVFEGLPEGFTIGANVNDISYAFRDCEALTALPDGFTVSDSVTDMSFAFYNCPNITELPTGFSIPKDAVATQAFYVGSPYTADDPLVTLCDGSDFAALSAYDWASGSRSLVGQITYDQFSVDTSDVTYTGSAVKPSVSSDLELDTDYTVEYADNINAGTGIITITGKGNYTGTLTYEFTIVPAAAKITCESASKVFGEADPILSGNVAGLINTGDLGEITYIREDGEDVASYTITADYTPNNNYNVEVVSAVFTIVPAEITYDEFNVDTSYVIYDGTTPVTKTITSDLVEGVDYTVEYAGNDAPGRATITIRGEGNYTGELFYTFKILNCFEDVGASINDANNWYFDAVYGMVDLDAITGYSATMFGVGDAMSRAQLVTVMWRYCEPDEYAHYDESTAKNTTDLPDVEDGTYYTGAANWAYEAGVITGNLHADGTYTFNPNDFVSFDQLVTIVGRYCLGSFGAAANYPQTALDNGAFTDKDTVEPYALGAMSWAIENGVVTGNNNGDDTYTLDALSDVARERAVTVLYRSIEDGLLKQD